ncbi:phosphotransferase [Streptomyces lydicamycinicus]|uniref:Phosphotransferase n=1 Tax=Streptomyces lydicamycinicus TaxID=1546107 RepID=A0A0P4R664_9ACTN|nr:phosphotransferase [Streptomyces lydicamycinicus]
MQRPDLKIEKLPVPRHPLARAPFERGDRWVVGLQRMHGHGIHPADGPAGQTAGEELGERLNFRQFRHNVSLPGGRARRVAEG